MINRVGEAGPTAIVDLEEDLRRALQCNLSVSGIHHIPLLSAPIVRKLVPIFVRT